MRPRIVRAIASIGRHDRANAAQANTAPANAAPASAAQVIKDQAKMAQAIEDAVKATGIPTGAATTSAMFTQRVTDDPYPDKVEMRMTLCVTPSYLYPPGQGPTEIEYRVHGHTEGNHPEHEDTARPSGGRGFSRRQGPGALSLGR